MPMLGEQATPMMRSAARLQYDLGRFLFGKEGFHLSAPELTPQHRAFIRVDTMQREHVLGRIDCNALKLHLDGPSLVFDNSTLARNAVGPSTPTSLCDQNRCAQSRNPMEMMRHGCSSSLFQVSQQWSTMFW